MKNCLTLTLSRGNEGENENNEASEQKPLRDKPKRPTNQQISSVCVPSAKQA